MILDYYVLYTILKRLVTPFDKWEAFERGIIDKDGNVLRKRSTLTSQDDKKVWTRADIFVANLKKTLAKIPGGGSKLATLTAALFLLKEQENLESTDADYLEEKFMKYLKEEAPTVNVGGGNVAGVGVGPKGEPGVSKKKKKSKLLKRYNELKKVVDK